MHKRSKAKGWIATRGRENVVVAPKLCGWFMPSLQCESSLGVLRRKLLHECRAAHREGRGDCKAFKSCRARVACRWAGCMGQLLPVHAGHVHARSECHVMAGHAMPSHDMSCHTLPCHAMPCQACLMPCHATAMLTCHATATATCHATTLPLVAHSCCTPSSGMEL